MAKTKARQSIDRYAMSTRIAVAMKEGRNYLKNLISQDETKNDQNLTEAAAAVETAIQCFDKISTKAYTDLQGFLKPETKETSQQDTKTKVKPKVKVKTSSSSIKKVKVEHRTKSSKDSSACGITPRVARQDKYGRLSL